MDKPKYTEAIWNDDWRILGTLLRPLSIGHAMLLQRLGLAYGFPDSFWEDGKLIKPQMGDLILSVGICGRPFMQAERFARSRWLKLWSKWRSMVYLLKYAPVVELHHYGLCHYILEAWSMPPIIALHESKHEPGAPLLAAVKCALMSRLGMSERDALECPLRKALWEYAVLLEQEGIARLQNATEDTLVEAALKMAKEEPNL